MDNVFFIILIGTGATVSMDLWALIRKQVFNIPTTNWGMVGRWLGHILKGTFYHDSIATSTEVRSEHVIGWAFHYLVGISYAILLVIIYGQEWVHKPSIGPAMVIGITTVLASFLIMQPSMGGGIAASRTPTPNLTRLHSLIAHIIFGLGLYASGLMVKLAYSL